MNHLLKENREAASLLNIIKDYKADMGKLFHPELKERLKAWLQNHYST